MKIPFLFNTSIWHRKSQCKTVHRNENGLSHSLSTAFNLPPWLYSDSLHQFNEDGTNSYFYSYLHHQLCWCVLNVGKCFSVFNCHQRWSLTMIARLIIQQYNAKRTRIHTNKKKRSGNLFVFKWNVRRRRWEKKVDRCNIFHRDVICKVDVKSRARKETKRMKKKYKRLQEHLLGHSDTTENAHFSSFCLLFTLFRLDLPVKFNLNYLRIHEWWNSIRVIQCLRFVESLINYWFIIRMHVVNFTSISSCSYFHIHSYSFRSCLILFSSSLFFREEKCSCKFNTLPVPANHRQHNFRFVIKIIYGSIYNSTWTWFKFNWISCCCCCW